MLMVPSKGGENKTGEGAMSAKLKPHPYADLFPMMTADEFGSLVADIDENGLLEPIVLYQGKVLDGRNRLAACEKAQVKPEFKEFEGDSAAAMRFVLSRNNERREMTG